jgi:peptidoglycan/xylan/chitin deacetylase (PgdA/CDA1 family)
MRLVAAVMALGVLGIVPAAFGQAPALELHAPAAFSPDGNGIDDQAAITVTVQGPSALTVEILRAGGEVAATLASGLDTPPGTIVLHWDGSVDGGRRAADGVFMVRATAVTPAGEAAEATASLRVDTKPPRVVWLLVPGRAGKGPVGLRFRVTDRAATVHVTLYLTSQAGRRWRAGSRSTPVGTTATSWPLRAKGGGPVPPGAYRLELEASDGVGNEGTSPAEATVVSYPVTTRVVRRVDGAGPRVALTFDDCNEGAAWARILDTLADRNLRASFFCLGTEVGEHAALARRALRAGHTIGNHTWKHTWLPSLSFEQVGRQLRRSESPWWKLARATPLPWFRPPYGALDTTSLAAIGNAGYLRTVLWDVDPQDWRRPGAAAIAERAVGSARPGSIILLHVIAQTADALPSIISGLAAKGLRPVSLDELLG